MSDDPLDDVLQRIAYELLIYHEHMVTQRDQLRMDEPDEWPDITGWHLPRPSAEDEMARLNARMAARMAMRR